MKTIKSNNIHVVIPCYNAEETISPVINGIIKTLPDANIVLIDDGSKKDVSKIIQNKSIITLRHRINLGQWAALRTGFIFSLLNGADIIVTMDADGQHSPKDLPNLLDPVLNGKTDFVQGSRFLNMNKVSMQKYRSFGIKFFNILFKQVSGVEISDCTSGYKVYRTEVIKKILPKLLENQYGSLESLYHLTRENFTILEKEIQNIESTKSYKGNLSYGYGLLRVLTKVALI